MILLIYPCQSKTKGILCHANIQTESKIQAGRRPAESN